MTAHERLAPGVWRLPLPSDTLPPYTHTNSYLVVNGPQGMLVDIGSDDPLVLAGLGETLAALGVTELTALLLTHTHRDHCAGAGAVQQIFGVPVYAHPLEQAALALPTRPLHDGESVRVGSLELCAHHTPGHSPGHLSFHLPQARTLLVGDMLAAQGSTWVGHPRGDVADYLASLDTLSQLDAALLGPGHGPPVYHPEARLSEVRAHRLGREAQILRALRQPLTLAALREAVYPGSPEALKRATEGALLAHLGKLRREGRVVMTGNARYQAVPDRVVSDRGMV